MAQHFSNNVNSWNTTINFYAVADEKSNILAWLSSLDPRLRHQDIQHRRVEKVGEWLLQTEEFKGWYAGSEGGESNNAVLFCCGDPGVGKTYISSLVIDSLGDQARGQNATVACFYFDFAAQKEQTSTSMLGALLRQLVAGLEKIPEEISREYQDQKNTIGGRVLGPSNIVKMLQTTSSKKPTFICIDALDECGAESRVKLLGSLNHILQKSPGTRIFVTGRPHIQPEIGRRLGGRVTTVSVSPKRDDIISYLHTKIDEDTIPDEMDRSLKADILKKIPEDLSEIFLLVSLNIDAILQETTIHRRRERLRTMTDGLGLADVYGATLSRIKGQGGEKSRLAMVALMWISHAERPLKPEELCHALAVEIGSPNLNPDNVPSIGTVLACCQGLVVTDKEASTVRLTHFTLQEYLRAYPDLFGAAPSTMAETCLSYLNSQQVMALSTSPSPDIHGTPFLEYSSLYWGIHAKRDLSECAKSLALRLFSDYNNHVSIQILLKAQKLYSHATDFNKPLVFSGLHCASIFGIADIVASLLPAEGHNINQRDCAGNTPLVWAADNGHEGVIEILLGWDDVKPNQADRYGRTPLYCAAENGYERAVKMLLEWSYACPEIADGRGRTPLHCAAQNGHGGVVRILLEHSDADPDRPDEDGQAPLGCAAENGHEGVVEILLERDDVIPDKPNAYGHTPLHCAVENGHEGVVKILLAQEDLDPDEPNDDGQAPLYSAAESGYEGVVKILLARNDVNPDRPNKYGETPLCCAAWHGHEGVVRLLLGRDGIDPNKPDGVGRTPLCSAAASGQEGVVKILLGRGDVNPNKPGRLGRTPLWLAARNGHGGVVGALLEQDNVDPDQPDEGGQTPLCCAAENGHEGVVRLLLPRNNINPNKPDGAGQTPLRLAAKNGHAKVIALLQPLVSVAPSTT